MNSSNTPDDIFGVRPFGQALETAVRQSLEGIGTFLSIVCKPVLEELGMMARDRVRVWRLNNVLKILEKSKTKLEFRDGDFQLIANPKVALAVIENGCNETDDDIQELWAGLLNSSMSETGTNDDCIIYVSILKQLSAAEVRLLRHMCEYSKKGLSDLGLPIAQLLSPPLEEVKKITRTEWSEEIEAIFNHFSALRLNEHRYAGNSPNLIVSKDKFIVWLTPSTLALTMYIRCQGFKGSIAEYWNLIPWSEMEKK